MADDILTQIIDEHLPYEIDMLRNTWRQLERLAKNEPTETAEQTVHRFALIESFCVHARSLCDFFECKPKQKKDDAIATDFTAYKPSLDQTKEPLRSLRTKLNKQVFHLTTNRTMVEVQRIDVGSDGTDLLRLLEPEIAKFEACLRADGAKLKCNSQPIALPTLGVSPFNTTTTSVPPVQIVTFTPPRPKPA
jgi:hypothetical protein